MNIVLMESTEILPLNDHKFICLFSTFTAVWLKAILKKGARATAKSLVTLN